MRKQTRQTNKSKQTQNKREQTQIETEKKTKKTNKKTCIHSSPGFCRSLEDLCSVSDMS